MVAALALIAALAAGPSSAGPATVLSFTGAASRGAYQAGVADVFLRVRAALGEAAPPLVGMAGVSAGGANAALAALLACRAEPADSPVDESPLFRVWDAVEWRALFPHGGDWEKGDGLSSMAGVAGVLDTVSNLLARSDGWRPGCRVALGISLASARSRYLPDSPVAGLASVRAHALLTMEVREGRPVLCAAPRDADDSGDPAEHLILPAEPVADAGCHRLAPDVLRALVRASIAPPVYTSAQPLVVCSGRGLACEPVEEPFFDGVLLEAIPLGLSLAVGQLARPDAELEVRVIEALRPAAQAEAPGEVIGFAWYRRFFDTFLTVARYYEAQTVARYRQGWLAHPPIRAIARVKAPEHIFGDSLLGMGAFLHPALRRADFERGRVAGYEALLPRLCGASPERVGCVAEVLRMTGATRASELRAALEAVGPVPGTELGLAAEFLARECVPETLAACRTGALLAALHAHEGQLGPALAAAEAPLATCAERFDDPEPVRLPDGAALSDYRGWLLGELRRTAVRASKIETAGAAVRQGERLLAYGFDRQRAREETGLRTGTLGLAQRPEVPTWVRVFEHALYPSGVGGLLLPHGGVVVQWEHLGWAPRRDLVPLGLGATLRWIYNPLRFDDQVGLGPSVFGLWDPRAHALLSSLGLRAALLPDLTQRGGDVLRATRVDTEALWRFADAHLELAGGPSVGLFERDGHDRVDYRLIVSLVGLNVLLDNAVPWR